MSVKMSDVVAKVRAGYVIAKPYLQKIGRGLKAFGRRLMAAIRCFFDT